MSNHAFIPRFRDGYGGARNVRPEVIYEELQKLEERGEITAQRVVDAARPEDAPMHHEFEWNDAVAGEKYRLGQARQVIRSIVIVKEPESSTEPKELVSAYVHVPSRNPYNEGSYASLAVISEDVDKWQRMLREIFRRIESAEAS